jgi:hypothetical protein
MSAMHGLAERSVTFDYEYNMRCSDCPGVTSLSGAEYYSEANGAHMECARCGGDIHFGRAVMALRDANDPVLDDQQACRVCWYHTSTDSGWPGASRPMPASEVHLLESVMRPEDVRRARREYEDQALHLGKYETAIESMLRRMRDQGNGGAQFYLYRVGLRRDGLIIEQGWCDENLAEAAQVTQSGLGVVDAVRYLNVYETPGSISLAVRRTGSTSSSQTSTFRAPRSACVQTSPAH